MSDRRSFYRLKIPKLIIVIFRGLAVKVIRIKQDVDV